MIWRMRCNELTNGAGKRWLQTILLRADRQAAAHALQRALMARDLQEMR